MKIIKSERICLFCGQPEKLHYEDYEKYYECDCKDAIETRKILDQIEELKRKLPKQNYKITNERVLSMDTQQIYLIQLYELADEQHPHMKGNNHTREMIDKAFSNEKLSAEEAFDCGKYYQRMLEQPKAIEYLSAILNFKYKAISNKK